MNFKLLLLLLVGINGSACFAMGKPKTAHLPELKTVDHVNVNDYLGKWYEIARYPNKFQKKCLANTSAEYSKRNDGKIDVFNRCVEDLKTGAIKDIKGKAKIVDTETNAKLKVTFFWPFAGDYWIIELGEHYEYAVIGEPSREFLWILSRTSKMDETLYKDILSRLASKGYDANRLVLTPQSL